MNNYLSNNHYMSSVNIDLISNDAVHSFSDTHKLFILNEQMTLPDNTHFVCGVQSFVCPYTFYNIRTGINDTFTITTPSDSYLVTIDAGTYANTEMLSYLNTVFTTAKVALGLTTLSMNLDQNTNKFYLSVLPASNVTISSPTCYKELGFQSPTVGYSWTSATRCDFPYVYNMAGDTSLYIRLHHKGIKNVNSKNIHGILCNIPVGQMSGDFIFYNPTEIQYFKTTSNMTNIELSILDDQMNDIGTLNTSTPWRITLTLHYSYNHDKLYSQPKLITNEQKTISDTGEETKES
jgi:hypothetical protein